MCCFLLEAVLLFTTEKKKRKKVWSVIKDGLVMVFRHKCSKCQYTRKVKWGKTHFWQFLRLLDRLFVLKDKTNAIFKFLLGLHLLFELSRNKKFMLDDMTYVKCLKICHILWNTKTDLVFFLFHLIKFSPNECPNPKHRPGYFKGKNATKNIHSTYGILNLCIP